MEVLRRVFLEIFEGGVEREYYLLGSWKVCFND